MVSQKPVVAEYTKSADNLFIENNGYENVCQCTVCPSEGEHTDPDDTATGDSR